MSQVLIDTWCCLSSSFYALFPGVVIGVNFQDHNTRYQVAGAGKG